MPYKSTSDEAEIALKASRELHEGQTPVGINIEKKTDHGYNKKLKANLPQPLASIHDDDGNTSESEKDSECIFSMSPDHHHDAVDRESVSISLPRNTDKLSKCNLVKDTPSAIPPIDTSSTLLERKRQLGQHQLTLVDPSKWIKDHKQKTRLSTIIEDSRRQQEAENMSMFKATNVSFPELSSTIQQQKLTQLKGLVEDDPRFELGGDLEKGRRSM